MPSRSDNPTSPRGRGRPAGWTVLTAVLLLGLVLAKPHLDEWIGSVPEESGDGPAATSTGESDREHSDVGGRANWLTEVRTGVFESPAGLVYGPGGSEGHRIDHIMRHSEDDADRPVHGVFDGDHDTILALLDEAFETASERGPPVEVEQAGTRTVYTIDMDRRVGFIGGESGRRNGYPDATHIRLVLEDRNVITAFPLKP